MQSINMIMINYWDKELKKRLYIVEADIIASKEYRPDVLKNAYYTGHILNDRHCTCLSNNSLSY